MKTAFVDTQYFVAVFQPSDQWHQRAISIEAAVAGYSFVTTDAILTEVLNFFCEHGPNTRREAVVLVESVLAESSFFVVELNREWFQRGVNFYGSRPDKGYSLTDCLSMEVCRELGINEVLTHDHHFTQEGFEILL